MQESTVLVTSRPVASGELQEYCTTRIEIVGFTPAEVSEYFKGALREAHQEGQHATLQQCLEVRPVIQASCYLPLNAAIVVHLFITEGNTLPTTLHSLFTTLVLNCIVRHLKREKEGKRLPRLKSLDHVPLEIQPYFNSICALAFHGIKNNKATFSEVDLHSVRLSTDSPDQLLSLIQGWSTFRSAWEELSYSFFHLSVQELLAAYYIHKHCPPSEQIQIFRELLGQPRFAAVLQFYAAFTKFLRGVLTERMFSRRTYKAILDCLYEAQDPSLCQYVAGLMNNELNVDYTVSPLHCMVLGYFLCCIAPTDRHGKFHIRFHNCSLDEYKFAYLNSELKKCSCGQLSLSLHGEGEEWNKNAFAIVRMLENSSSHCICELKVSVGEGNSRNELDEFLLAQNCRIPQVSLDVTLPDWRPYYDDDDLIKVMRECDTTGVKTLKLWGTELLSGTLSGVLAVHRAMDTLELSGGLMGRHDARALFTAIATNTILKSLKLSDCKMLSESITALVNSLAGNSGLKELSLSGCYLSPHDLRALADSLLTNNSLEVLVLSRNNFGDGRLWHIIQALKVNAALKALDISYCYLGALGVRMLEHLVTVSKSLETLILSGNDLSSTYSGRTGAHYLAQGLRQNASLRRLSVEQCKLTDDTLEVIVGVLEPHPSMQEINLCGNLFTSNGLKTLSNSLKRICHLQKVTLGIVGRMTKVDQEFTSFVLELKESRIDCIHTISMPS